MSITDFIGRRMGGMDEDIWKRLDAQLNSPQQPPPQGPPQQQSMYDMGIDATVGTLGAGGAQTRQNINSNVHSLILGQQMEAMRKQAYESGMLQAAQQAGLEGEEAPARRGSVKEGRKGQAKRGGYEPEHEQIAGPLPPRDDVYFRNSSVDDLRNDEFKPDGIEIEDKIDNILLLKVDGAEAFARAMTAKRKTTGEDSYPFQNTVFGVVGTPGEVMELQSSFPQAHIVRHETKGERYKRLQQLAEQKKQERKKNMMMATVFAAEIVGFEGGMAAQIVDTGPGDRDEMRKSLDTETENFRKIEKEYNDFMRVTSLRPAKTSDYGKKRDILNRLRESDMKVKSYNHLLSTRGEYEDEYEKYSTLSEKARDERMKNMWGEAAKTIRFHHDAPIENRRAVVKAYAAAAAKYDMHTLNPSQKKIYYDRARDLASSLGVPDKENEFLQGLNDQASGGDAAGFLSLVNKSSLTKEQKQALVREQRALRWAGFKTDPTFMNKAVGVWYEISDSETATTAMQNFSYQFDQAEDMMDVVSTVVDIGQEIGFLPEGEYKSVKKGDDPFAYTLNGKPAESFSKSLKELFNLVSVVSSSQGKDLMEVYRFGNMPEGKKIQVINTMRDRDKLDEALERLIFLQNIVPVKGWDNSMLVGVEGLADSIKSEYLDVR